jgi:hypothetical protein
VRERNREQAKREQGGTEVGEFQWAIPRSSNLDWCY